MKHVLIILLFLSATVQGQKINSPLAYTVNPGDGTLKRPPMLVMLHGYGSNEMDLFELARVLDPRLLTVAVRAPNVMGNGAFNWFEFSYLNGKRTYDNKAAAKSRSLLLDFITKACRSLGADSNQVYVLGFSQGAILSFELAMAAPAKIKGIMALSGRLMEETKLLPADLKKLKEVAMFIAHGKSDQVIPIEEYTKVSLFFREKQIRRLKTVAYEMPHSISGAELNDIKVWLTEVLNEKPALTK